MGRSRWPQELRDARSRLVLKNFYLANVLYLLEPVEFSLGTLAIDNRLRLFYDPAVFTKWTPEELAGVLYHETQHFQRDHFSAFDYLQQEYQDKFSPELANICADAEINDDLLEEGVALPDAGGVQPTKLGLSTGQTLEQYYAYLVNQAQESENSGDGSGTCTGIFAEGKLSPEMEQAAKEQGARGISQGYADYLRDKMAREILGEDAEALDPGKPRDSRTGRGSESGSARKWAERRLRSKYDWKRVFSHILGRALEHVKGHHDYTYAQPSRRQSLGGTIVFPSLISYEPRIALVLDASGSMDGAPVQRACDEALSISALQGRAELLVADTQVNSHQTLTSSTRRVELAGFGGTDMGAGMLAALELSPRPDVIIVLTDAMTPWPAQKLPVPCIVAMIAEGDDSSQSHYWNAIPAWCQKLFIRLEPGS